MNTARELFLHELSDLLDCEQRLIKALDELAKESKEPELKKAFEQHREQTQGQANRIQEAFELLGEKPEKTECRGIIGIIGEHDSFKKEKPSDDILTVFDIGAAIKTETYEICAYNSTISIAEQLGYDEVIDLLQQNLDEEEETLEKMQEFSDEYEPEELGIEEEEEEESAEFDEDEEEVAEEEGEEEAEEKQPRKSAKKSPPKKGKNKRVA